LRRLIPWLRARRAGWSDESDRAFHDALFAAQDHDAFSPAYTGNITIRRFADLTQPFVEGCRRVVDVGCGPGEITCELARRNPDTRFLGVDHSSAGISVARANAERLALANVEFEVADMADFDPGEDVDLVAMFDAFHHLLDPRAFIERMGKRTSRFLLIEPQGDWKGSWVLGLDLDWLALDVDKIRGRLAHTVGETRPPTTGLDDPAAPTAATPGGDEGEPVENRYSVEAFEKLFAGYGLRIRGTVSGLDQYPPEPTLDTPSRRAFGELTYELYQRVDELLFEADLDLHAKHLVIHAERGAASERRERAELPGGDTAADDLRGAHDVEYVAYEGPITVAAGEAFRARVRVRNRSFRVWSSGDPDHPDMVSYHWLDQGGRDVIADGARSPLPRGVPPDGEVDVGLLIEAPTEPGSYVLAIDMVHEGKAWFRDAGSPTLDVPFTISA